MPFENIATNEIHIKSQAKKYAAHTHTDICMCTQPLLAHSTADGLRTCCFYYCIYCTYCAVAVVVVGCAPKNFH